jgi:hypothetical protein
LTFLLPLRRRFWLADPADHASRAMPVWNET